MNFNEYQRRAANLNLCPQEYKLIHAVLGLVGEAGEVAEKFKKIYRDKGGEITNESKENIKSEISDVLWYISDLSNQLGISLQDVAEHNIQKLESRKQRGVLCGNGDNR